MAGDRGAALVWAVGFGVLTGAVTGSLITTADPARELQYVAGFAAAATAALYVVLRQRWDAWADHPASVRFVVYFLSLLVATVVLAGLGKLVVPDAVRRPAEVVGVTGGFAVAVWSTWYGGAERLWAAGIDALDVEW